MKIKITKTLKVRYSNKRKKHRPYLVKGLEQQPWVTMLATMRSRCASNQKIANITQVVVIDIKENKKQSLIVTNKKMIQNRMI